MNLLVNVKVDLSNYTTKADLKDTTRISSFIFATKSNLASLKIEVDKLDIDKLLPVPVDLRKLSDAVKNGVVKKTVYDKLFAQVNDIDISGFLLKTEYDTGKSHLEKKLLMQTKKPDTSKLVEKTNLNAKASEIESTVSSITVLVINAALTAIESKIPDVNSLVSKSRL